MASTKTFNLAIKVNDKESKQTLNSVGKELKSLRSYTRNLEEGTEKWHAANKKLAEAEKTYDGMKKRQREFLNQTKEVTDQTEKNKKAIQDFGNSASQALSSLMSGDLIGFQEGMKGIATGIKGATRAGLAFIATPIGAAIAALSGVALAAGAWFKYNEAALEALRLTKVITGLSDQAADKARVRAEAITETFDGDFKQNLESASTLVQQFGISYDEAFDLIEDKLARGQKHNDEFFQSIKEYPSFFNSMKFSAEEFANVIAAGYDLKIYSDKLPDALKEADLALKEQTKTTRDALVNAFGAPFSDAVLKKVRTGELTTKDALKQISNEADKNNINIQQNAQLTADLFKGAGEDAGGALKVFEALNMALNEEQKELSESQQLIKDQSQATTELKEISSALFFTGDKGFGLLIEKAKLFGTKTLINLLKTGVDVVNWFVDLNNKSSTFSGILSTIGVLASVQFEIIGSLVDNAKQAFSGLGEIIEGAFTLDQDKIKSGLAKTAGATDDFYSDLKNKAIAAKNEIAAAFSGENKFKRVSIDGFVSETGENKEEETTYKDSGTIDEEAKKRAEKEKAIREKVAETLKEWEAERAIKEELEKFEKDQRAEERELLELEDKFAKLEEQAEGEKELLARLEEEKELQIQDVRDKYSEIRLEKKTESDKKIAEEERKLKDALIEAEFNLQDAKNQALGIGISALRGFFGEATVIYKALLGLEKALAINEIIVSASKGIAAAQANLALVPPVIGVLPNPLYPVAAAIAAKNILATKISAGAQIAGIAATTIKGFDKGGYTDLFGMGYKDESGHEVAGVVHKNEYVVPEVVRQDPEVPPILDYLEAKRKKSLGLYADGGDVGSGLQASGSSPSSSDPKLTTAINRLVAKLDDPLVVEVLFGYEAELKRQKMQEKLSKIKDRSKIK